VTEWPPIKPRAAFAQDSDDEWVRDCRDNNRRDRLETYCTVRVETLRNAGSRLRATELRNGGASVRAWDRPDIEVHARIHARARSESEARDLAEQVRIETSGADIRSSGPRTSRDANWYVHYVIYAPTRTDVVVESTNGPVSVTGIDGRIEASTVNGPLSLRDLAGEVRASTQNGPLTVRLSGSIWRGAGLHAETRNGPVNLQIPDGYSARLETGTVNGPMESSIPLTVTFLGRRNQQIESVLGNGGPTIHVTTQNGPLSIDRR
jgi:DUF4097 and DUF4098 domain-containing protein YvlB